MIFRFTIYLIPDITQGAYASALIGVIRRFRIYTELYMIFINITLILFITRQAYVYYNN